MDNSNTNSNHNDDEEISDRSVYREIGIYTTFSSKFNFVSYEDTKRYVTVKYY